MPGPRADQRSGAVAPRTITGNSQRPRECGVESGLDAGAAQCGCAAPARDRIERAILGAGFDSSGRKFIPQLTAAAFGVLCDLLPGARGQVDQLHSTLEVAGKGALHLLELFGVFGSQDRQPHARAEHTRGPALLEEQKRGSSERTWHQCLFPTFHCASRMQTILAHRKTLLYTARFDMLRARHEIQELRRNRCVRCPLFGTPLETFRSERSCWSLGCVSG